MTRDPSPVIYIYLYLNAPESQVGHMNTHPLLKLERRLLGLKTEMNFRGSNCRLKLYEQSASLPSKAAFPFSRLWTHPLSIIWLSKSDFWKMKAGWKPTRW